MKINFFLPGIPKNPVGGYKVVYQYANALSENGHEVCIIHVDNIKAPDYGEKSNKKKLLKRLTVRKLLNKICLIKKRIYLEKGNVINKDIVSWFTFDKKIRFINQWDFNLEELSSADVNIATAWNTAILVDRIPDEYGEKFYFIQGYENWQDSKVVDKTFNLGFHKIVVASWLQKMLEERFKEKASLLPNFVDFNDYYLMNRIENRDNNTVAMLYHESETKGTEYGLEAIKIIRERNPDIKVILFGVYNRPNNLPQYIEYHKKPNIDYLRDYIYNKSSIFISPSILEGWGLTITEAMACGASVVVSDSKGINDFIENGVNGLVVEPKNARAIADKVDELLNDNDKRIRLAKQGNKVISNFTLDRSMKLLEKILEQ
ncbi:glycosyltransferase family 4 protein [Latilactobacillus sakei]|uniref:glycosyltransferase family 4 protein n=1 Tax=Latilactobacillus sakei TaxID=1599 RepID=UPI00232B5B25|nr:glycosyltransferase family 4 protein [Latilactobacillus sakei]MDB1553427.1 glycosyltransferase family 4 protein [Latilactobacillus sakei]